MQKSASYKRKVVLIDKDFQLKFIWRFILMVITISILIAVCTYGFYYFKYKAGGISLTRFIVEMGNYSSSERGMFMTDRFELIIVPMAITFLAFILLSFIFGIVYSHKLAGPIYRLEKSLIRIIEGDRDFEVRLRKKDQFKKFEILLNRLIKKLNEENAEIIKYSEDIHSLHKALEEIRAHKQMRVSELDNIILSLDKVSKKIKMNTL